MTEIVCQECNKPLTGRRRKFCSMKCIRSWWTKKHRNDPEYQERINKRRQEKRRAPEHLRLVNERRQKRKQEPNGLFCQRCGSPLTGIQKKFCSDKCKKSQTSKRNQERRIRERLEAFDRFVSLDRGGNDGEPACAHCGCSDIDMLDIAHENTGDGAKHRKEIGGRNKMVRWVIEATDKEILDANIRIECCSCNSIKNRIGRYPSAEELLERAEYTASQEDKKDE